MTEIEVWVVLRDGTVHRTTTNKTVEDVIKLYPAKSVSRWHWHVVGSDCHTSSVIGDH